jgi:ElaB/YqjD/DUF883 family membrane-anchored ribosome-binding protein
MDVTTEGLIKDLKHMKDAAHSAEAHALEGARDLNRQVHDNPWAAIGIAAGVGLVVGILLARR